MDHTSRHVPDSFEIDNVQVLVFDDSALDRGNGSSGDWRSGYHISKICVMEDKDCETPRVVIRDCLTNNELACDDQRGAKVWKIPSGQYMMSTSVRLRKGSKRKMETLIMRPMSVQAAKRLDVMMERVNEQYGENPLVVSVDHFDQKTDKASSDLYFHYYGMLQHQQNMLQDYIRTGTYFAAITENAVDFRGKAVMDVGCGSGILSLFAARAGARVVYAVEASNMAAFAQTLFEANPECGSKIRVLHGKVEEVVLPEKVDVLVSEPMGTLLVNERMLETYFYARDHHLREGGKMFPGSGTIYVSAFSDEQLYQEIASKSLFWQQNNFYGVDLTCLHHSSYVSYFSQVVVDQIPPNVLVSNSTLHKIDFSTCKEEELHSFEVPLSLQVGRACTVHGIAAWFDVSFDGTSCQRILSTAPGMPVTHWFQLRCVLQEPIRIYSPGETIKGILKFKAHARQSYDLFLELSGPPNPNDRSGTTQFSVGQFDLKEPYYRQLVHQASWDANIPTATESGFPNDNLADRQQHDTFDPSHFIV